MSKDPDALAQMMASSHLFDGIGIEDLKDLIALYTSMGHGTTRKPEGKQAAR